jgi:putative DNA primase/helicase
VPKPPKARHVTSGHLTDVKLALSGEILLSGDVVPPAWIVGDGLWPAGEVLACNNLLVHLPSLVEGRRPFACEPTHAFFSFNVLPYDFLLDAPPAVAWVRFLGQLWPDDPGAVALLQEWFGLCLTADTSQQKILLMVGPKRSGKGTIGRVLRALVGPDNCCSPSLNSLTTNFGLWALVNKTVAIVPDARLSGGADQAPVVEKLLSISGEDAQTFDRKYLSALTVKLTTRFTILSNELPRLGDASGALASRFLVLNTPRSWYGKEDTRLTDKLLAELPSILLWAVEGWRRLNERGRFLQCPSGADLIEEMTDLSSPVGQFVKEVCALSPDYQVDKQGLYDRYLEWARCNGITRPLTAGVFGRDLIAAAPGVRAARTRAGDERLQVYLGIDIVRR